VGRGVVSCVVFALIAAGSGAQAPDRRMAVTFDDLPIAGPVRHDADGERAITTRLLDTFEACRIPVVGFVIGNRVAPDGAVDPGRLALLKLWIDRRFELGNHTFSHADFHATPLDEMKREVSRAEDVLATLTAERGQSCATSAIPCCTSGATRLCARRSRSF
jgi:peptidoglycan/xylan/chitin deacetylase (PgdA/CDA1 family)